MQKAIPVKRWLRLLLLIGLILGFPYFIMVLSFILSGGFNFSYNSMA